MVTVYTQDNCQPCKMTKRELGKLDISYKEINLSENPQAIDALREQGFMSAPVVITDSGDKWAGFMPTKIRSLVAA